MSAGSDLGLGPRPLKAASVFVFAVSAIGLLLAIDLGLAEAVALGAPAPRVVPAGASATASAVVEPPIANAPVEDAALPAVAADPPQTRDAGTVPPSPLLDGGVGATIALAFAPGFTGEDLRAFVAATGSVVCMVAGPERRVARFVAPGPDGMPAVEEPVRRFSDFVQAHRSDEWLFIPCTAEDQALAPLRAQWPGCTPCVVLSPEIARRVFRERSRQLPGTGDVAAATVVELAAMAGRDPQVSVRPSRGARP